MYKRQLVISAKQPGDLTLQGYSVDVDGPNEYAVPDFVNEKWRNDLVWVDADGDGRLTLPLTNRPQGSSSDEEPAGPFDFITFSDSVSLDPIEPERKNTLTTVGDVVDAGGWELVEELFYAGEPTSEASTGRVIVSINSSVPGSAPVSYTHLTLPTSDLV